MKPKVSVIMPTYNNGQFIEESIRSILSQEVDELEIVVVDDHSTDDTADRLKQFNGKVRHIRLDKSSGGPSKPRNIGLREARGEYIALCDSDDVMLPGKLKEEVQFLDQHKDIPFVFTNFRNMKNDGETQDLFLEDHADFIELPKETLQKNWFRLRGGESFETLLSDNFIGTSSVLMRRSLLDRVGHFDESLPFSEDWDFWIRVVKKHDVGYINKDYHRRRIHGANLTSDTSNFRYQLELMNRLKVLPMSKKGRKNLNQSIANVHFDLGYWDKEANRNLGAMKHYLLSIVHQKTSFRALMAFFKVLLTVPVRKRSPEMKERRKANVANRLMTGSVLKTLSLVLGVGISFFMMPYMVRTLGDKMYGVWTLVAEFLWYYGMMDFGLSTAIGRFLARAVGRKDKTEVREVTSTSFYLTSILGLVCLAITMVVYAGMGFFFKDPGDQALFRVLILILGVNFAVEFPVRMFNAALAARLRYDLSLGIEIGKFLGLSATIFLLLYNGYGVIAMALASVVFSVLDSFLRIYFAKKVEPDISLSWRHFNIKRTKTLFGFSFYVFVMKIAEVLKYKIDLFVITAYVGLTAVTHYFIGIRLVDYFMQFIVSAVDVVGPVYSQDEGRNDFEAIRRKFLLVTKGAVYLSVFFGGLALLYGHPFIARWMGDAYFDSYLVLVVLILPSILGLIQAPADSLLVSISRHRFLAVAGTLEGTTNLVISLLLAARYGILGVAMGTAIPMTVRFLIQPFYACRVIQLDWRVYVRTLIRHVGIATLVLLGFWSLTIPYVLPEYVRLISIFVLVNMFFWPVIFFWGFSKTERGYVVNYVKGMLA